MKYRGRSDIVAEILKIAKDDGASKTRIMYGAYLSYAQLKDYMAVMLENRLLEKKDMKYQTTRKGLEFLRHHERMGSIFELPSEAKSA